MKKYLFISYIFLFTVLFCLPVLQNIFALFPPHKLSGVEEPASLAKITLKSWFDRSFQRAFQSWYGKTYGLRDYFIRTDNQINYTLFNQVNSQIVLGKQNQLFERQYIIDYLNWNSAPENYFDTLAQKLKSLQQYLLNHNIKFIFIITPSKASIYPEYIPEYYLKYRIERSEINYKKFVFCLIKYGVNYLDGQEYCFNLKQTSIYPVFPKGGTHWNYYTSFLFTQLLLDNIKTILEKPIDVLKVMNVDKSEMAFGTDADLADLTNMWNNSPFLQKSIFPIVKKTKMPNGIKPKMLFVGKFCTYHSILVKQI